MAADSVNYRRDRIQILGISVDTMRRSDIERRIVAHLGERQSQLWHIATVNPEYIETARRDALFRAALDRAELSVPDGIGIIAAARVLHAKDLERITGVDLVEFLLGIHLDDSPRIFLLGNPRSIAELQGRRPSRIVGRWGTGTAAEIDDEQSIARIRERNANVVLVGYGAPGQVLWIERNRQALSDAGVKIAIGVGGALDYVAGTVERAPASVQHLGLEWLYRLLREPWRWKRQLVLPLFVAHVARDRIMLNR